MMIIKDKGSDRELVTALEMKSGHKAARLHEG